MQDVITHPCPNFSGYLAKLGHEVVWIYGYFINYPCPKSRKENTEMLEFRVSIVMSFDPI